MYRYKVGKCPPTTFSSKNKLKNGPHKRLRVKCEVSDENRIFMVLGMNTLRN